MATLPTHRTADVPRQARISRAACLLLSLAIALALHGGANAATSAAPALDLRAAAGDASPVLERRAFLAGGGLRHVVMHEDVVLVARGNMLETWHAASGEALGHQALPRAVTGLALEEGGAAARAPAPRPRRLVALHGTRLTIGRIAPDGQLRAEASHDLATLYPQGLPAGERLEPQGGLAFLDGFVYLTRSGGMPDMRNNVAILTVLAAGEEGELELVGEQRVGVGWAARIVAQGDRLYGMLRVGASFGATLGSLWLADISRRDRPQLHALVLPHENDVPVRIGAPTDLAVVEGHVVALHEAPSFFGSEPQGPGSLRVIDARDPSAPRRVAHLEVAYHPTALTVDGRRAFVLAQAREGLPWADEPTDLLTVELSHLDRPQIVERRVMDGRAYRVVAHAGVVALGARSGDLRLLDQAAGAGLPSRHALEGPGPVLRVAADGDLAAVLREDGVGVAEVELLDLSDPRRPRSLARVPEARRASHVALRDGLLVVVETQEDGHGSELRVLFAADRDGPRERGRLSWRPREDRNPILALAWLDDRTLVVSSRQWLGLVDLGDPDVPRLARTLQHGADGGSQLAVADSLVLVAPDRGERATLITLDAEPSLLRRPIELASPDGSSAHIRLALHERRAWIAHGSRLYAYGFEGPERTPRRVATHAIGGSTNRSRAALAELGGWLLIVEDGEMRVFDVGDNAALRGRQTLTLPGSVRQLALAGGTVLLAQGEGGLHVLGVGPEALPWRVLLPWADVGPTRMTRRR